MRRFIVGLVALVVGWLGCTQPAIAAVAIPSPMHNYAYDSGHHSIVATCTMSERGPPARYDYITTNAAVDHWLGLTCSGGPHIPSRDHLRRRGRARAARAGY
jgi:hypothetical protein